MCTPESHAVIRLIVRNHPGVLSHVCGLFARRAFNLEAIACVPRSDQRTSVMMLAVVDDERLPQAIRQLAKLEDVESVVRLQSGTAMFADLAVSIDGFPEHVSG